MSDVKRYICDVASCTDCAPMEHVYNSRVVLAADYDRLEQECERQSVITGDYIAQFQLMRDERDAALKQVEGLRQALMAASKAVCSAQVGLIVDAALQGKP